MNDSMNIAICAFNVFSSYTAIMLNIITILALRKTYLLPKTLKTLLLSLVVSDLGVGLLVQPMNITIRIMTMELRQNAESNATLGIITDAFFVTMNLLCCASILGVTALSVDRFLAVHLHLRYQELVTHKRVVGVVISIWVFSAFFSLIHFWPVPKKTSFVVNFTILIVCLVSTAVIYVKLYLVVRHHLNPIHVLQEQGVAQNGEVANSALIRQRKSAVTTFCVYVVFLVCYLPNAFLIPLMLSGQTIDPTITAFTDMMMFLNSSLNPLIYSWRMRHIRHTIMSILHNTYTSLSNI